MNDRPTTDEHDTKSHERAVQNREPSPIIPAKREGDVVDGSGKPLHERDDRSPLDGAMDE